LDRKPGKIISLVSFNKETTSNDSDDRNAKTIFHEMKSHIDFSTDGNTQADMNTEHTRLGVNYCTDRTGTTETIIPNSPMDKFNSELEYNNLREIIKFKVSLP